MPDVITDDRKDTAWVTIEIPVPPCKVFGFLQNTERLFRLNPYLDIRQWEEHPSAKRFHLHALNEMNGVAYDLFVTLEDVRPDTGFLLSYDKGLKKSMEITLQPGAATGSIVTLRDRYHTPAGEDQLKEVDRSLIPWANSIRQYLLGLERWGWFWPYRWYRERFWLNMRPFHRRITRMLIWVTTLEFVVFLFVFTIYWLELMRR
ncbi:MAG: hypothetical protein ACYC05_05120 [Sulfuricella sp.]